MVKIDLKLESIKIIQKKYPNFDRASKSLDDYAEIFINACKKNQPEILEAILQLADGSLIDSIIHSEGDLAFFYAAENGYIDIVNRLIKLVPGEVELDKMIHYDDDCAFRAAAREGHLKIVNKLVELTPIIEKLDKMLHFDNNYAFRQAVKNGHLSIVNILIELTPDSLKRQEMIGVENGKVCSYIARNCNLELGQWLLSFEPGLKSNILHQAKDNKFRKKIEDSSKFIQKLTEIHLDGEGWAGIKVFEYLKYGKIIATLVSVSKSFFVSVWNPGILDVAIDYLGGDEVNLTRNEKINIFNVVANNAFSRNDNGALEFKKNISVDLTKNIQDQKLTFVERVLAQKAINKKMPPLCV